MHTITQEVHQPPRLLNFVGDCQEHLESKPFFHNNDKLSKTYYLVFTPYKSDDNLILMVLS